MIATMNPPSCPAAPATEIFCSPKFHPCFGKKILYTPDNQLFSDFEITSAYGNDSFSEKSGLRKRKVRFAPPCFNEYVAESNAMACPEEKKNSLWWSQEELDAIKDRALYVASEAREQPIVVGGLDQALELAVKRAALFSEQHALETYLAHQEQEEEERGLKLWCQYGHSRRGLEKYTSMFYNEMRKKDIYKLTKMVMVLKKRGAEPDLIRQVSEQTSRASVVYARLLAVADHNAVINLSNAEDQETSKTTVKVAKYPSSA